MREGEGEERELVRILVMGRLLREEKSLRCEEEDDGVRTELGGGGDGVGVDGELAFPCGGDERDDLRRSG